MKNYTKAVLYAYPLMKNIEADYAQHIENCALLSYRSARSAEENILYIANEIIKKQNFAWLKACVERVLDKLSLVERTLIAIRYFGKERNIKRTTLGAEKESGYGQWSDSKYFRRLRRISDKVGMMLEREGVSEEIFLRDFADDELFQKIYKFVCEKKDNSLSKSERRWLGC